MVTELRPFMTVRLVCEKHPYCCFQLAKSLKADYFHLRLGTHWAQP